MERKIKDLRPGQTAWTLPWALHKAQGTQWLHPEYSAYGEPGGTVDMKISALAPGANQVDRYFVHSGKNGIIAGLAPFGGPKEQESSAEHETWLEYHDRLVREYFDGERELLEEIYPEKVPRQALTWRTRTRAAVGGVHLLIAGLQLSMENYIVAALALLVTLLCLPEMSKVFRR